MSDATLAVPLDRPEVPDTLPLLPVRDIVVFPNMVVPLFVGRESSIHAVRFAMEHSRLVMLASQKVSSTESPQPSEIYTTGTIATVMRMITLSDGRIKLLLQGMVKAKIVSYLQSVPFYTVRLQKWDEPKVTLPDIELHALIRLVRGQIERIISFGRFPVTKAIPVIEHMEDPSRLSDLIAQHLGLTMEAAQDLLETVDPVARLKKVSSFMAKEIDILTMQQEIQVEAKGEIDKSQREYFLREQMKAIQKELNDGDERSLESKEFREKIAAASMPKKVEEEAEKQVKRMEKMHPDSAETANIRTYLEWLIEMPWSKETQDKLDLALAEKVLNEDHYGLDKVKERIVEYLAVCSIKKTMKGPILCFVGPPGVGKTSLGRSIARAMGREFVLVSLGGVHDEAEIRGHRRTYIGALPGRIIQGIKQAGTKNPIFMLDEIDKVGTDFRGDPSSALLEVLDPKQNHAFSDHYLGLPFDLSKVMFITTANQIDPIPTPLKDRMEIIHLSGYTLEEKVAIARQFLIPQQMAEHGVLPAQVRFDNAGIRKIIAHYTREAGVRNLEREIAHIMRKTARKIVEGALGRQVITGANVGNFLGTSKFQPEAAVEKDTVGIATGLAWTPTGGDIIRVEATMMRGKGGLSLTGNLGDVMKESAQAALSYIRSNEKALGISPNPFSENDIHIHVPSGAIPKDGPSAGITMATALASLLTGVPVRRDVAMTGEVTLRGRVLQIGGLKEKVLAAKRAGMKIIVLPKQNEKDLDEIPPHVQKGLKFVFANDMSDVLTAASRQSGFKATPRRHSGRL